MRTVTAQVGRVIRVGRGWVDVSIERKVRRIRTRPDLLVRPGNYLQIVHDQGIAVLSADQHQAADHLQ